MDVHAASARLRHAFTLRRASILSHKFSLVSTQSWVSSALFLLTLTGILSNSPHTPTATFFTRRAILFLPRSA